MAETLSAEKIAADLKRLIKGKVLVDICQRIAYSVDASIYQIVPACVVVPFDVEDVSIVVRYAAQHQVPIAPRGAGSGLAGESLTSGIMLDMRQAMARILQIAEDGSWVVVEPGVIFDVLNRHLAKYGRRLGPDPSSGNRAVIGGIVANNATGAHSLQYGYISRYVADLQTVTADGTVCDFVNQMTPDDCFSATCKCLVKGVIELLSDKTDLIAAVQPKTPRNRCGYSLFGALENGKANMAHLLTGSEGTLGIFTRIKLLTVPAPAVKALIQFEFTSMEAMAQAIEPIVRSGADACELMDQQLARMARAALSHYRDILPENAVATLLVEQSGDSAAVVQDKITNTLSAVGDLASHATVFTDPIQQARLWKSRKDAVPLLNRQKSDAHPLAFIEDVSVPASQLDKYIAGMEQISRRYGFPMAYYGHAGDGELHIRPYLDLRKAPDIQAMRDIASQVYELAWSLGGSISGEHADGLLRAAFIRRQYGEQYYQLLKEIKSLFDPKNILNPGKIINDDPDIMVKNLRSVYLQAALPFEPQLSVSEREYRLELEQCNGCGVCLAAAEGTRMCPVFRGLNEELATSRAKTSLIAAWLEGLRQKNPLDDQMLKYYLSLCVNCKMCSVECPAGVDISTLVIEARAQLAKHIGYSAVEMMLIHNRLMSLLGCTFAPLSNWLMAWPGVRWIMEKTVGLDRHRPLPRFERGQFVRKAQYLTTEPMPQKPIDKVVYFVDAFVNFNDHSLGFDVLNILRALGVYVVVPPQRPAPMPAFVYGDIEKTRRDIAYSVKHIAPYASAGWSVVCSEPSAALLLSHEMRLIDNSKDAKGISEKTVELVGYIYDLICRHPAIRACWQNSAAKWQTWRIAYHMPCHLRPLRSGSLTLKLLADLAGLEVIDLNSGCCGLAGTAGMQAKKRALADGIGKSLKEKIDLVQPEMILTECAACKMQIETMTKAPVLHPISLLAKLWRMQKGN